MKLSAEQVKHIQRYVDQSEINIDTLKDDVLDHLCCGVEYKMESGMSFEQSLREALQELAPDGLDELEHETIRLLESKNIPVKKLMYLIGLATTIAMTIGMMFNILHLPGGFELFNYGFLSFVLVFLPMVTINSYKQKIKRTLPEKLRLLFGFLSAVITGIAVFFKMMHFPWVDGLLISGVTIFSFGFLPFLFYSMYVKSMSIADHHLKQR
jgi:hypothetical protein